MKKITFAILLPVLAAFFAGCRAPAPPSRAHCPGDSPIATFRVIPGVTEVVAKTFTIGSYEAVISLDNKAIASGADKCPRSQCSWLVGSIIFSACAILLIIALLARSRSSGKRLEKLVKERTDEINRNSEAKSRFLANMSHEIRTPMNSIIGFAELALAGDNPPKTDEYLEKITDSARLLLSIINDILDISKIESGKMELERVPFDLHDIFEQCRAEIAPKAGDKGLALSCVIDPPACPKLLGDPFRLRQAIVNILINAVKFTEAGTVKLLARVAENPGGEGGVAVRFEITDTGIGMTPEQIARVFKPFMQADNSITRKYGGTGLGLAITKNIIEIMGGSLDIRSDSNVGSVFGFELRFDIAAESGDAEAELGSVEKPNLTGEVLVCDDNPMNLQVISEHLDRVGLKYVVTENGMGGVAIVEKRLFEREKPFDLILMDIHMPVMDGLEAALKITELGVTTPIVAMTANIMQSDLELYKNHGMPDVLGKPFTSQDLWKCLLKYFTPESVTGIAGSWHEAEEEKMLRHLRINFAKCGASAYSDITKAISDGDAALARRLAHTLKGNAGQIGETSLMEAAAAVESALSNGQYPPDGLRAELERELETVLEKLNPLLEESLNSVRKPLGGEKARELFDRLESMLKNRNPESMNLLHDIRAVPGAENLAMFVEDFDFTRAAEELAKLKPKIERLEDGE